MSSYVSKRTPRVKQAEALEKMRGRRAFALLMGMRVGKTKPILDEWGEMVTDGTVLDLLVVAPAGAYLPWATEAKKDLPDDILSKTMVYTWVSGKTSSKSGEKALRFFMEHEGPRILLMNVEALSQVQAARDLTIAFGLQHPGRNEAVVDESVVIKNPEAECSMFCVMKMAPLFEYRRILTGLISPRSPLDVYSQFKFLDTSILGHDKFTTFKSRYAKVKNICMLPNAVVFAKFNQCLGTEAGFDHLNLTTLTRKVTALFPDLNPEGMSRGDAIEMLKMAPDGFKRGAMIDAIPRLGGYIQTIPTIEGYDHVTELHEKIAPHSFRARLEDCYDMPPSDYSFRDVEMTDEQKRIYHDIKEFATAQLTEMDYVTAPQVIVRILRLHQVLCGHTKDDEDGKIHLIPERRTKSLIDLLSDYDGKAVIWCSYDVDVRKVSAAIEQNFGKGSVARFWGGNKKTREEEEVEFKTLPECRHMVATPDAGGRGRTWDVANLTVYYSSKNNLDHRAQSEDRVKADGKMTPNIYVDMRCPGTVEEKIIEALREKIDMAAAISGDNWKQWLI